MIQDRIQLFLDGQRGLLADSTIDAYRERLNRFASFIGTQRVTPLLCKQYVPHLLAAGLSRRSALAFYSAVQTLHVWLLEAGLIAANPVPKLRRFIIPKKERPATTPDDVASLLEQCRADGRRDWYYMVLCGSETGLRLGDCASLKWCEVDLVRRVIIRTPIKTRRFGTTVEIPISAELVEAMRDCPPYPEGDPSCVCPTLNQHYLFDRHKSLSAAFIYLSAKAGVNKSFHALRHGRTSTLLNKGTPLSVVRSITGHSLKQLESYSHVSIDEKRAAIA